MKHIFILKEQLKFLTTSIITILLSIIGMIIFHYTGLYIIHPILYLFTLLMGIGWTATAIMSILNNKRGNDYMKLNEDLIYSVYDNYIDVYNTEPSDSKIAEIVSELPKDILNIGETWGFNDTVFREKVYNWIKDNKE